jgi:hypothetical protein
MKRAGLGDTSINWNGFAFSSEIKNKKIINSFSDSIVSDYESIFERFISDEKKKNPKVYPEFKTLYNKFKRSKPKPYKMS